MIANPSLLPLLADIADPALTQALQHKLDQKTKPQGSLGRLELLALKIGQILGGASMQLASPQMVVFAGDHGLTAQGVSAYPSDVSWQMVENFLAGGAAVSVLARHNRIALTVVDCGVKHDFLAGLPAGTTGAVCIFSTAPLPEGGEAASGGTDALAHAHAHDHDHARHDHAYFLLYATSAWIRCM